VPLVCYDFDPSKVRKDDLAPLTVSPSIGFPQSVMSRQESKTEPNITVVEIYDPPLR